MKRSLEKVYAEKGCRCVWMADRLLSYSPACKVRRDARHRPRRPKGARH